MENQEKKQVKRTYLSDIAEIAIALDGRLDFQQIYFSQCLIVEHGKSVNDLLFVEKRFGIYFYTSKTAFQLNVCNMHKVLLPTYVICEGSKNVYEIKNTHDSGK